MKQARVLHRSSLEISLARPRAPSQLGPCKSLYIRHIFSTVVQYIHETSGKNQFLKFYIGWETIYFKMA